MPGTREDGEAREPEDEAAETVGLGKGRKEEKEGRGKGTRSTGGTLGVNEALCLSTDVPPKESASKYCGAISRMKRLGWKN